MNKAFTKESDNDDELEPNVPVLPAGFKNYITPAGLKSLKDELLSLIDKDGHRLSRSCHGRRPMATARKTAITFTANVAFVKSTGVSVF